MYSISPKRGHGKFWSLSRQNEDSSDIHTLRGESPHGTTQNS